MVTQDMMCCGFGNVLCRSLANDFALLFTDTEFDLSEHIDTICLPQVMDMMSTRLVVMIDINIKVNQFKR